MNVSKKETGFRQININYLGEGKLNDFEKRLVKEYEKLHEKAFEISKDIAHLEQKIEEMKVHHESSTVWIKDADKMIEKAVRTATMTKEGKGYKMELSTYYIPSVEIFSMTINDYNLLHAKNNEFALEANAVQLKIINSFNEMNEKHEAFEEYYLNGNNDMQAKELDYNSVYNDYSEYVISFDALSEHWTTLQEDIHKFIEGSFNPFAVYVNGFGERFNTLNQEAVARNETPIDPKVKFIKNYELPANSEQMTKYATMLDQAATRGNGIYLDMSWAAIERNDTSAVMDIIRVAQHKTDALRNVIYGIQFKISDLPLSEPMGSRENIFRSPKVLAWFAHLGEIPMIYFFFQDSGSGFHCLFADLILDGRLDVIHKPEENMTFYGFQSENIIIIFNRLFEGAIHFLEFCYGTGVDARPHVEYALQKLREGFQLDDMFPRPTTFKYEEVEAEWKRLYRR